LQSFCLSDVLAVPVNHVADIVAVALVQVNLIDFFDSRKEFVTESGST
jgi:hypothetical protein